jgi:hypothetical protein
MPERTINGVPPSPTPAGVYPKGSAPADAPLVTPPPPPRQGVTVIRELDMTRDEKDNVDAK